MAVYLGENNSDISGIIALSTTLFLDGFCMPWCKFMLPLGLSTILRYYYTFPEDECLGIKNEICKHNVLLIEASDEPTLLAA